MILTLEIVGEQAEEFGARGRKVFHAVGGTIGRLPDNDWVFPDPYVSGRHALIRYLSGKFFVEDTSTNGVYLNSPDNRLQKGQPHALKDGDLLYIDAYRVGVSIESEAGLSEGDTLGMLKDVNLRRPAPAPAAPARPATVASPVAPVARAPADPSAKPAPGRAAAPDPTVFVPAEDDHTIGMHAAVDDSKTEWVAPKPAAQDDNRVERMAPAKAKTPVMDDNRTEWMPAAKAKAPVVDDNRTEWMSPAKAKAPVVDDNRTEWMSPAKAKAPVMDDNRTEWMSPAKAKLPVVDDNRTEWMPPAKAKAPVMDDNRTEWIGIPNTPAGDDNKTAGFVVESEPAPTADIRRAAPQRPIVMPSASSSAVKAPPPAVPASPKVVAPEPAKRTAPPVAPAAPAQNAAHPREPLPDREPARAAGGRSDEAMMRQVLASAGIVGVEPTQELAQTVGEILRIAVAGMMEVQRARERLKDELRVRGTIFKPAHNNPLKFSANVEDAFHNLLLKHNAAYLDPTTAFEDAFHDVRDHHSAIMSALRLAFESMLAQFDPARMQDEFDRQMKKGSILGVPVKLRYWELYRDRYGDMVKDADTSFRHLFGDKFAVEYEGQLERLKSQNRDREK